LTTEVVIPGRDILFTTMPRPAHPASYIVGTGGSFLCVKLSGCDSDNALPSSAEIKNMWSYTSTPLSSCCGAYLSTAATPVPLL